MSEVGGTSWYNTTSGRTCHRWVEQANITQRPVEHVTGWWYRPKYITASGRTCHKWVEQPRSMVARTFKNLSLYLIIYVYFCIATNVTYNGKYCTCWTVGCTGTKLTGFATGCTSGRSHYDGVAMKESL